MTAPKPNAELAYRVLDHIDAHPESWIQGQWDCGTAACFAGWAVRLSGCTSEFKLGIGTVVVDGPAPLVGEYVEDAAMQVLGISNVDRFPTDRDADPFAVDNTREDLGRLVAEIFGPRPEVAASATGPYGVADWRAPLTDFERRAGVIEPGGAA